MVVTLLIILVISQNSDEGVAHSVLVILISAAIYGCLLLILTDDYIKKHNLNITEYGYLNIVSLNQSSGFEIHGDFVLGCGSIDGASEDYYITYANFKNGLKRIKINAYDTYLLRSDTESPKIKNYYKRTIYKPFKSIWLLGRKKQYISEWFINDKDLQLIVPKNTVKVKGKFNIDH